ncbi:MAG: hypothetical protein NVSMB65_09220 [Chloroflexota bacterium]
MGEEKAEYLGPMARSIVDTFAGLTIPQQRRVFAMLREVLDENERMAEMLERLRAGGVPPQDTP